MLQKQYLGIKIAGNRVSGANIQLLPFITDRNFDLQFVHLSYSAN
jgi:hypothetical protein